MCDSTVGNGGGRDGREASGFDSGSGVPVYRSSELFRSFNEIIIRHESATYRLRITRQGKLILNK
ncbi:MAG: hemin uptake protein HemP [Rhodobiaceae bacterium]|nr:hemin uptake protein HemP [Rhodobiaceae bacterium]MCC0056151.1 hemin uptake protein HemP [Rhodobiaceae bacterium]